jgi:hypothetical protein
MICHYAQWNHAECRILFSIMLCHYAECRYAVGALLVPVFSSSPIFVVKARTYPQIGALWYTRVLLPDIRLG